MCLSLLFSVVSSNAIRYTTRMENLFVVNFVLPPMSIIDLFCIFNFLGFHICRVVKKFHSFVKRLIFLKKINP